jgi:hypothetical protein
MPAALEAASEITELSHTWTGIAIVFAEITERNYVFHYNLFT